MLAHLVIPALVATTSQPLAAGEPVGAMRPARSIHEWMTQPVATPCGTSTASPLAMPAVNSAAMLAANSAPKPYARVAVPKSPMTISITSSLRKGSLVVALDDVPIFNEKFQKPILLISQTTTWDPLQVAAGKLKLSAKVLGTKKTYFSKTYDLDLSRTKSTALRFVLQGDKLTIGLAS
jgi:hypothetical protein